MEITTYEQSSNIEFTLDQTRALEALSGKRSVFLTGGAGTGKSFVISQFMRRGSEKIPVLASTGAAAVIVGGRTFHSFFGLGIMEGSVDQVVERAIKNKHLVYRIRKANTLIVDEISMVPGPALDAAERLCRWTRETDEPWGGIRMIFVGDFAQLPPISRGPRPWAFKSEAWQMAETCNIELKELVRSKDAEFNSILGLVRKGEVTSDVVKYLDSRVCHEAELPTDCPRLFPLKKTTEGYNATKLEEVDGAIESISSVYTGKSRSIETLKKQAPVAECLLLKVGAYVMLRQNDPKQRWVNGSTGWVRRISESKLTVELEQSGALVRVEKFTFSLTDADGEIVAAVCNFPVSLAYATTIHKSQGQTLTSLVADISRLWEPGQAYVAMSRLTKGTGLHLTRWSPSSIKVDPEVVKFYSQFSS